VIAPWRDRRGTGRGDRCVGRTPEPAQVCRGRVIGGVQRRQAGREYVEALAAVLAGFGDACGDGGTQQICIVGNEVVGQRRRGSLPTAVDRPDQRVVARVEFRKAECFVHLLDPAQLLRAVQAATMIARRSSRLSQIAALDWYLTERLQRALDLDTPDFDFLLRFDHDDEPFEAGLHPE
jgi:hypothetical protein